MADEQTADADHIAGAVMEAFQALRCDNAVERLPVGSQARRLRIRSLLEPIAAAYGMSAVDLSLLLAKALSKNEADKPGRPAPVVSP